MQKSNKKQAINKTQSGYTASLINYLNRIITTQTHLFETDFSLDSFMNFGLSQILALTKAMGAAIELWEEDHTIFRYTCGSMKKHEGMQFDINDSIALLSIHTHQIIRSDHAKTDERLNTKTLAQIGSPASLIIAPLFHEGKPIGALSVFGKKAGDFDEISVQAVKILAGLMSYAISQHFYQERNLHLREQQSYMMNNLQKAEKELEHSMHHDYLTGLPNGQLFNNQLSVIIKKAKRKRQLAALLYMNIDHFQRINETLGHTIGDKLLSAFASRLKQNVRTSDIIARLGGDEFVLLVDDIKEAQDAIVIVDKIMQAVRKPFNINKKMIPLTMSIGIAFLNNFNVTADEFIRQADQALYISKNSGRNTFYIFNSELQHETI